MGHNLQAIITTEKVNESAAEDLHLPIFKLNLGTLIGLHHSIIDFWSEKLSLDFQSYDHQLSIDCNIVQYFTAKLKVKKYAIVQTNYFGGSGFQAATVYANNKRILRPRTLYSRAIHSKFTLRKKPVNKALSLLGISRTRKVDEFTALGLQNFRNVEDYFYDRNDELLWSVDN